MPSCDVCGFVAKTAGGLGVHRRAKHPDEVPVCTNRAALEVTLDELVRLRRFERVDAARIQTLKSLAAAVDVDPFNAQMWRQYREALADVLRVDDDADDSLAAALEEFDRVSQPDVGDT